MRVWRTISLLYFGTYTIIILQFLQGIVLTGPVIKRSIRMIREVYPEIETDKHEGNQAEVCIVGDVVYGADEPVPSDQPCLKCKCQPPGVQCEAIQCSQKQGCKAIHKSNQCCPEYQCECLHNGTFYGNGERLATLPGGECSVCYCRGGEVQCANVSCYKRTDCEGRTVPGQCCPKYDHCPLKEPAIDRSIPRIAPTTPNVVIEKSTASTIYDIHELNILSDAVSSSTSDSVIVDSQHENVKNIPSISIQEIIPERKEIPITTAPKQNINVLLPKTQTTSTEPTASKNGNHQSSDLLVTDTDSESSEISETYHHPPPVLKIGDKLLIFKKGELIAGKDISTPVPVITIIGAEGLQRGTEDSSEFHEISSQLQDPPKDIGSFDDFFDNETSSKQETTPKETHIISFVKQKKVKSSTVFEEVTEPSAPQLEFEEVLLDDTGFNFTLNEENTNQTNFSTRNENVTVKSIVEGSIITVNQVQSNKNIDETTIFDASASVLETKSVEHTNKSENTVFYKSNVGVDNSTSLPSHILINPKAALPTSLLKQPAIGDLQYDDFEEVETRMSNETDVITSDSSVNISEHTFIEKLNNSVAYKEDADDSGESTTARNNQTLDLNFENASIETAQNSSIEFKTTDMVEILPGFQITTEDNKQKEQKDKNETQKDIHTTAIPIVDSKIISHNTSDEEIFLQLNKEFNNTFSSLNFTAFKNNEEGAQAIFKELLEEVASSTLPPYYNSQESSLHQLHEKETQLLQKVSEAISKFQSKESKELLHARILGILKDFFNAQHKLDNETIHPAPFLQTV